jgi:hypothetical protein
MMNESQGNGGEGGGNELTDQEKDQQRLELEQKRQLIDQYRRDLMEAQQEHQQLINE